MQALEIYTTEVHRLASLCESDFDASSALDPDNFIQDWVSAVLDQHDFVRRTPQLVEQQSDNWTARVTVFMPCGDDVLGPERGADAAARDAMDVDVHERIWATWFK